jgi:tetratricopeptide (TPR) repeat protein
MIVAMSSAANLDQEELVHLAIEASGQQRHGDAIEYLKQSLAKAKNFKALYLLAAEHAQIGMTERAIEEFRQALEIEPGMAAARFQLGLLFLCNARVEEALDAWQPLEKAVPAGDPYAVFAGGLTKLARDEFTAAATELRRGMEINRVNAALNADMKRVLERIEAHLSGDVPPPQSGNGAQPGQFLLSAYTKTLN